MGTGAREHEISHYTSSSPPHTQGGHRCARAMHRHRVLEEEQGGAEWAWSLVRDTPPSLEPRARRTLPSGPGIGPRQLSLAKRVIPDWLRPRLPPPPPGGGTWVQVCGSCSPRGSRSPTSYLLATAKPGPILHPAANARCAENWQLLKLKG